MQVAECNRFSASGFLFLFRQSTLHNFITWVKVQIYSSSNIIPIHVNVAYFSEALNIWKSTVLIYLVTVHHWSHDSDDDQLSSLKPVGIRSLSLDWKPNQNSNTG